MAIKVSKRENEPTNSLIYRFSRKVQQSGVLREVKKRRFHARAINRNLRRKSALHREKKKVEVERAKKLGKF